MSPLLAALLIWTVVIPAAVVLTGAASIVLRRGRAQTASSGGERPVGGTQPACAGRLGRAAPRPARMARRAGSRALTG
jgi:hypothetical protein